MRNIICALILIFCSYAFADEKPDHHKQVNERGDHVMGFRHDRTEHHFKLEKNGGIVAAEAKDPKDQATIDAIRKHFKEAAGRFAQGDFSMPEKIHGRVPPGVPEMIQHKDHISYETIETAKGGEIHIKTDHSEALHAVHEFLRFQIQDHRTGDAFRCHGD